MQMRFHPDKCKVLHLGYNNPNQVYHMTKTDGTPHTLEDVTEEKDLGVLIDEKLTFSKHIQNQTNKANQILGIIRHTFKTLDKNSFLLLYKGLVRPHLEYASPTWNLKLKKDKDTLEKVQKRATSLVKNISHLPYSERLQSLNLPTLLYRRQRTDVIQCFKLIKGIDNANINRPCPLCNRTMFPPTLSTTTRGHKSKIQIQHQQGIKKTSFATRVAPIWNKLTQDTIDSTNVNQFKGRLANEWKKHPNLYNYMRMRNIRRPTVLL